MLEIPALDVQLTAGEAVQLAQLLAAAAGTADRPTPAAHGNQPWDRYADAAGALRPDTALVVGTRDSSAEPDVPPPPETTDPADQNRGETAPPQTDCVLPLSRQTYLQSTATTSADLDALAPPVTEQTSRQVRAADPDLDADLADWADWACTRPKAALLGPVSVTAQGRLPDRNPRLAWNTEVVAYLATRPRPVTSERYGTDLWPDDLDITSKTKVRQSIAVTRAWLVTTLRTGHPYLPTAQAAVML